MPTHQPPVLPVQLEPPVTSHLTGVEASPFWTLGGGLPLMLLNLDPVHLCTIGCVSRSLRLASNEKNLWCRAYDARWASRFSVQGTPTMSEYKKRFLAECAAGSKTGVSIEDKFTFNLTVREVDLSAAPEEPNYPAYDMSAYDSYSKHYRAHTTAVKRLIKVAPSRVIWDGTTELQVLLDCPETEPEDLQFVSKLHGDGELNVWEKPKSRCLGTLLVHRESDSGLACVFADVEFSDERDEGPESRISYSLPKDQFLRPNECGEMDPDIDLTFRCIAFQQDYHDDEYEQQPSSFRLNFEREVYYPCPDGYQGSGAFASAKELQSAFSMARLQWKF